ncbi:MAG: hypothetical protein D6754_06180 [Alphaproteobacteria bacterium]|nr:MAG: hypothetical protein D6754_06180 [Alphaproteobacteria bacterium]
MFRTSIKAAVVALALAPAAAGAATIYPKFVVDGANSSVTVTQTGGSTICNKCLQVKLAPTLDGRTFAPTAVGDKMAFGFLRWKILSGFASDMTFSVSAALAFSKPDPAKAPVGGIGQIFTVNGQITGGKLQWTNPVSKAAFKQGSWLGVTFKAGALKKVNQVKTSRVVITAEKLLPVPIPAAFPLMAGGVAMLGGLGLLRRKRKTA